MVSLEKKARVVFFKSTNFKLLVIPLVTCWSFGLLSENTFFLKYVNNENNFYFVCVFTYVHTNHLFFFLKKKTL